jgi:hypothetical protein
MKLCKVKKISMAKGAVPYCVTHDGRTIRYPDPNLKRNDTVIVDLDTSRFRPRSGMFMGPTKKTAGRRRRSAVQQATGLCAIEVFTLSPS